MFGLFKKKRDIESKPESIQESTPRMARHDDVVMKNTEEGIVLPNAADGSGIKSIADGPGLSDFVPPPGMTPGGSSGIPGFDYSPVEPNEDFKAVRGEALPDGQELATEEQVIEALRTVYDPEIPVNIYDLGLIYGLDMDDRGDIKIDMTLTAPGCPVAGEMPGMVADAVDKLSGTGVIEVTLVWEPGWTPENMSEDAKLALGMG